MFGSRKRLFAAALSLAFLVASGVRANERVLVSFEEARTFAPMWPGGTFSEGRGEGLSWLQLVSDGNKGSSFVSNVRPLRPTVDATGQFVKVWFKIDDFARLGGMEFRLSSDHFVENYFAFTFPRYEDLDFNIVRGGVWTTLTFSFGQATVVGKPDRTHIDSVGWYLADNGNKQPVTAQWGGLALVDAPDEGVVSVTFDDGYDEHFLAAKLMQPYGFRGTAYIIPEAIGAAGYLTLHQMIALRERYGWDVESHHAIPFTDFSSADLEAAILGVQRFITQHGVGRGGHHLAYPLGKQDPVKVRPLVRKHFASARIAGGGVETLPPADPHLLRVFNVTNDIPPEEVVRVATIAREHGEWLILMFHYLVAEPKNALEYKVEDFERLLAGVAETGIRVLPVTEVFSACGRPVRLDAGGCALPHAAAAPSP